MDSRGLIALLSIALLGGFTALAWVRAEGDPPVLTHPESLALGSAERELELGFADAGAGLRAVRAVLHHARGEAVLADLEYPGNLLSGGRAQQEQVVLSLEPGALGLSGGSAFLEVTARDWSWRGMLSGNETRVEIPVNIDLERPRVAIRSGLTYVRRGGAASVAYSVSEATSRDGVMVGETFFQGFPVPGGDAAERVALFAVPTDARAEPSIAVLAEDLAGNTSRAGWSVVVQERVLPEAKVRLPSSFLERKVRPLAQNQGIDDSDLVAAFTQINTALRDANEERIRELVADSTTEPIWKGSFAQLRNSKVTSRFAEHRTYVVAGEPISKATHFGYDLASTSGAAITASNAGRVLFAGDLGIYGTCVLIDHGIGLSSLYAHLSRLDVRADDVVAKDQALGLSGQTGLAGGDHLHFAILVGGHYVDPLEWWDPKWVQQHIDVNLRLAAP